ncbi:gastrula zinc finger protein XlCGF7.1 [Folsomia candida]|uniref:PR domain zinc finger protein 5 n=1 Tax=Folsomia candida TaxID=158441 RepID=A0A226DQM3_FOLCA|nr:gastrula zinc finger protein XlCGF7.1 [Folsomia candida]OXA47380.1 PR domain zinc finger protein 5 [Folsomia candida]
MKPETKRECSMCSKMFKNNYELTRHILWHNHEAKVKCEICGKMSKNIVALSSHIWSTHNNRKRPRCDICNRVFSSAKTLRTHTNTVHSTRERPRFPCTFPGCEKTFLTKGHLSHHTKIEHSENPVRFPCTLCGREFKTRGVLEGHIHTHTTEKPFKCATCGRSFARKRHLKSHEMTHLEKSARDMLECHLCPQTLLSKEGLQHHVRAVHENRRNYACAFCDKRFSGSSDLKRHVEGSHATNEELIHSCDRCEFNTHSKYNLAAHKLRHKPAGRGCYFCGKKFFRFAELVMH